MIKGPECPAACPTAQPGKIHPCRWNQYCADKFRSMLGECYGGDAIEQKMVSMHAREARRILWSACQG